MAADALVEPAINLEGREFIKPAVLLQVLKSLYVHCFFSNLMVRCLGAANFAVKRCAFSVFQLGLNACSGEPSI